MTDAKLNIPADTQAAQRRASDPAASAWVAANAGSGKTHVLAQRVVRLLLERVPPGKILCLTFTKAAAANMAQRVFGILAKWALLDDDALARAVADTGAPVPGREQLVFARRLFARTIETPGGLKIQTIHAFCERLLHLFPFEANVSAGFEVVEEQERATLLDRARTAVLETAVQDDDGPLGAALRALAGETTPDQFEDLLRQAMQHRAEIAMQDAGEALRAHLGLAPGDTPGEIVRAMVEDGIAPARWSRMVEMFAEGSKNDVDQADRLAKALAAHAGGAVETALEHYEAVFFTQKGEARKNICTAKIAKMHPKVAPLLQEEAERLTALADKRRAAATLARTTALTTLAAEIFKRYEEMKRARSLLDFDDLIGRARALFARSDAAWVLYKLDAGIDHILVDEAQDTSPAQWEILQAIAHEFTAGAGQRGAGRTFFAVGDEKQSIYSFQGAAPHMFDEMRRYYSRKVEAAEQRFESVGLHRSFRSAPDILRAVDIVFTDNHAGLSASGEGSPVHEAIKDRLQGMVELWDLFAPVGVDDPTDWKLPLDTANPRDPASRLSATLAETIEAMVAPGSPHRVADGDGKPRPVRPGDIMVLVRARNSTFTGAIRALKERGVAVAGADRLKLTQHIAVMDLMAAGRAVLLPLDDLTLASVLKSPLIGLADDDLIALAPEREGSLRAALAGAVAPEHRDAARKLDGWRRLAEATTPFGFYAHLLGAERGRLRLLARLGLEAGDAIDEFLRLALAHERAEAPSLAIFLGQLEAADLEVKRDMEAAGGAVRVMTVHAAKGLEAKIVFMPDTCGKPGAPRDPQIFKLPGGALAWSAKKGDDPAPVAQERERIRALAEEEHRRLLYVAMTRAEERLYIGGFVGARGQPEGCWYNMLRIALEPVMDELQTDRDDGGKIWRYGEALQGREGEGAAVRAGKTRLPGWLLENARTETDVFAPVSPSRALAAADQFEPAGNAAVQASRKGRENGRLMHKLLQHLPDVPAAQRAAAGRRFLAAQGEAAEHPALLAQALALLQQPELAALFASDSVAEAAVTGRIARPAGPDIVVTGQIDRLAVSDAGVLIADYKTGAPKSGGDMPMAYVAQLALYRAVLAQLYPAKTIRALVIWTAGPLAVELDEAAMDAALALVRLA